MGRRLKIKARLREASSRNELSKLSTFDPTSGLGFVETVHHASPMLADWVWKTHGTIATVTNWSNHGLGSASLRSMAIRSVCANADSLTADALETVPWQIAKHLWKKLETENLDSLHAWKTFVKAYKNEPDAEALQSRRQIVPQLRMYLDDYIKQITSAAFTWITFLYLSEITCSRADMINIAQLANVATLKIGSGVQLPDTGIDDSIIRSWGRSASETGAFSRLRVLACRDQLQLTDRSFAYISDLPALKVFALEGCSLGFPDRHSSKGYGWRYKGGSSLTSLLNDDNWIDTAWEVILNVLYKAAGSYGTRSNAVDEPTPPILYMSIGGKLKPVHFNKAGKNHVCYFERMDKAPTTSILNGNVDNRLNTDISGYEPQSRKRPVLRQEKESTKRRAIKSSKQIQIKNTFTELRLSI